MIYSVFDQPFQLDSIQLKLTACIGISNSNGRTSIEEQINTAEEAMFAAKSRGLSKIFFYSSELREKGTEEKMISEKITDAMENDGFFMLYQPKVDVQTLTLSGYEALIRMKASGIGPGKFIPIAEKKGWIWRI